MLGAIGTNPSVRGGKLRAAPLTPVGCQSITGRMIYKIFRAPEWAQMLADGQTDGAPIDICDGYIHFSTATQAAQTAVKHFADQGDLFLIFVDDAHLGDDLKWEPSRGGALFPHLYRALTLDDVASVRPLPLVDGQHVFPEDMP